MNHNPLVSIVVPIYNTEKYIEKCVNSILNQSYSNIEIILINNGSNDNSLYIIKELSKKDERIVVIDRENNGVSGARNHGISVSYGDYIMFVDSDDWIDADCVESVVSEIVQNGADSVFWSYVREFEDSSQIKKIFDEDKIIYSDVLNTLYIRQIGLLDEALKNPQNIDSLNSVCTKIYDLNIIKQNNIEFLDLDKIGSEDGFFNICYFAHSKKAVYINKYFYHYLRINDNTLTKKYKENLIDKWLNLFNAIKENIDHTNPSARAYEALDNRIALSLIGLGLNICRSDKSVFSKIKELRNIITLDIYQKAYKNLTLKYFSIHWKLFFFCAKAKLSFSVYILLIIIKKIIGR